MATGHQIEVEDAEGRWHSVGTPHETRTAACLVIAAIPGLNDKKTRVQTVYVNERVSWVPDRLHDVERAAEITLVRMLAEDLAYGKANYAATLESIIVRARRLFDDEARLIGRGYKDGENTACKACDGVYIKRDK